MGFFNNLFKSNKRILYEKQSELTRQKQVLKNSNTEQLVKKKKFNSSHNGEKSISHHIVRFRA